MNPHIARRHRFARIPALLLVVLGLAGESPAADLGRLFYTPAQRAELEAARTRNVTQARPAAPAVAPPQRFDGVLIRSDGVSTSWINGRPQAGASGVAGLKPGQVRADGKIYDPYQVLPAAPRPAITEGTPR